MVTTGSAEPITPRDAIRKRPGMYVGDTADGTGMHELLWQVLNLVIEDRHREVRIEVDRYRVTIDHIGRDIALDQLERVLVQLSELGQGMHLYPGYVAPTCALSRELDATVWRDGRTFAQRYVRGVPRGPFVAGARTKRRGFRLSFVPDFTVFTRRRWDLAAIDARCRELAALLPGLAIACNDARYCYEDGLAARIRSRFDPCIVRATLDGVKVDAAIAWSDSPRIESFVNCMRTADGGPHVEGVLDGIEAVLAPRLRARGLRKRLARGLAASVHVVIENPRFTTMARSTITNEEVATVVRALVESELARHLEATPALLDTILIDAG